MADGAIYPCDPQYCSQNRDRINDTCHKLDYPPGHAIILQMPNGSFCYCICGGSEGGCGGHDTAKPA